MSLYQVIFYFFEITAALGAILLVFTRNVFYGALLLMVCLLSVAGLYVLAFAEFVAVTQILVYAGGILVLIIFGIMLTEKLGKILEVEHSNFVSGGLVTMALFILLCYYLTYMPKTSDNVYPEADIVEKVGMNIMTSHLIPFELAGILLLVALIGAAVIASHKSREAE